MKSIRIIKERIKNYEKLANDFVNPLNKKIETYIHGESEQNTKKHIEYIGNVLLNYEDDNFHINSFKFYENYGYYSNWVKDEITNESIYNDWTFAIEIYFSGKFDFRAVIKISSGHRNSIPIYYFNPHKNTIDIEQVKGLENILYKILRQEYISQIIDLSFKDDIFLEYSDKYCNYTIWDKKPLEHSNCIEGEYSDEIKESMIANLKKLNKCENIREYATSEMYGNEEEIKWIRYYL